MELGPSPPFRGEREGPIAQQWEGEVGVGRRSGIPHLTPSLSAPQWTMAGGEREVQRHIHPNTSENGRKSTVMPTATSLRLSSRMTKPSDCTIDDRMPAPSRGYLW